MPKYTGLKDFVRGMQKLYKLYGNVPVFIQVDGKVAPFGIALTDSNLLGGKSILLFGGGSRCEKNIGTFEAGDCTD